MSLRKCGSDDDEFALFSRRVIVLLDLWACENAGRSGGLV